MRSLIVKQDFCSLEGESNPEKSKSKPTPFLVYKLLFVEGEMIQESDYRNSVLLLFFNESDHLAQFNNKSRFISFYSVQDVQYYYLMF